MRFVYLNAANLYAHDKHLIDGLRELGHEVHEINEKGGFRARNIIKTRLREENKQNDPIIVGFPTPVLVLVARTITTGKIFFNACSSQYEANIVSRKVSPISLQALKWWLLDFLSFHLSTKVLLESNEQIDYVHKLVFISKKKLVRSFSGLNEKDFFYDPSIQKKKEFTVMFRGRFLTESGILTVIEAAKILENTDIKFRVMGAGFMYREVGAIMKELHPSNLEMINGTLAIEDLRKKMMECHISLGQLADHPRLERTLPCKLFESLALKLPYLTGRNKGALEVLEENKTCIAVRPGDAQDLADKILELQKHPEILAKIGEAGYNLYKEKLTSRKLAEETITACLKN